MLFYYLVGAQYQRPRYLEADIFRGMQVDRQLEGRRLLDRQLSNPLAAQHLCDLAGELPEHLGEPRAVTDQAAFLSEFGRLINRGQAQRCGTLEDVETPRVQQWGGQHVECLGAAAHCLPVFRYSVSLPDRSANVPGRVMMTARNGAPLMTWQSVQLQIVVVSGSASASNVT